MSEFRWGGGLHSFVLYDEIVSLRNLFLAWSEFKKDGKLKKKDVGIFAAELEENIFALHNELKTKVYKHGGYKKFIVCDPKRRTIHKASVRDRLLHHAIFRVLYPFFDKTFIFDSYSSRVGKGIHEAKKRFERFALKVSRNNSRPIFILKCDVNRFFDNIDHDLLSKFLNKKITDRRVMVLISNVIESFQKFPGKGIPLGNLTSQLFSNIYLDYFDQFVKRKLRIKFYIRYADDFVILSEDRGKLEKITPVLEKFMDERLSLKLHPRKISKRKWHQGIDFLGLVSFPYYSVLRAKTRKRIFGKLLQKKFYNDQGLIEAASFKQTVQSYKGILVHCRGFHAKRKIKKMVGLKYYKSKKV